MTYENIMNKNSLMKFCNTMKIIYELADGKIYIIVYHPNNTSDTEKEAEIDIEIMRSNKRISLDTIVQAFDTIQQLNGVH